MINGERGIKVTLALLFVWVLFVVLSVALSVIHLPTPVELTQANTAVLALVAGAGLIRPGSGDPPKPPSGAADA